MLSPHHQHSKSQPATYQHVPESIPHEAPDVQQQTSNALAPSAQQHVRIPDTISQAASPAASPAGSPKSDARKPVQALSSRRRCAACRGDITGHFVRALNACFHINCFSCKDCGALCAAKFFPCDGRPLCEHCYFKRQQLLCYRCGESLRGSYITALDRKYHVEHFTCTLCTTVFGPDDSYFEYDGGVYCRTHYGALFAFACEGCRSPILKQYVETYRSSRQQQWHPECYMIFKFWNVKVTDPEADAISRLRREIATAADKDTALDERAADVTRHEDAIDAKTTRIWTTLCAYEEACAANIAALVQCAVDGSMDTAHGSCARLVDLVRVLFVPLDVLMRGDEEELEKPRKECAKEAKTLCRKIISYMSLLSKTRKMNQQDHLRGSAVTFLSLTSATAHYLKVLIRLGLSTALRRHMLDAFLDAIANPQSDTQALDVSPFSTDRCTTCNRAVEDRCVRLLGSDKLWHYTPGCFKTADGQPLVKDDADYVNGKLVRAEGARAAAFALVTRLEQYVALLRVALSRLDLVLGSQRRKLSGGNGVPQTMTQVAQMSPSITPAMTPAVAAAMAPVLMPAPAGEQVDVPARSAGASALARASVVLHGKDGLTLDDIRRIVASEQAKIPTDEPARPPSEVGEPQPPSPICDNAMNFGMLSDDEYSWSQQIAAILLEPYARKLRTQLPADAPSAKQTNLWNKMGKVFGKDPDGKVFGQPLARLSVKYGVDSALGCGDRFQTSKYTLRIPSVLEDLVGAMRQKDMSVEGIFRKNGNIRRLREFVERVDKNPDDTNGLADESPIQLAALLKKFLRDMPDPLFTSRLSTLWLALPKLDGDDKLKCLQLLVCLLPRVNRNVLEVLSYFLNWVTGFAYVDEDVGSKMDIANIATVLAPSVLLPNEDAAPQDDMSQNPHHEDGPYKSAIEVFRLVIANYTLVARVPPPVAQCLVHVKGPPRRLSQREVQHLLKAKSDSPPQPLAGGGARR